MNKNQETLLKLIKQSQFKTSSDVSFDNVDLEELYKEASYQSVLGLVAPVIPEKYLNEKWKQAKYRQLSSCILYNHAEEELIRILDNEKIPFVILKGNAAAINYKEPSYRAMGDIDFLTMEADFERTMTILLNKGYILQPNEDKNNRHVCFRKNGAEFELHKKFSYEDTNIEDIVSEGFKNIDIGKINNHEFPMLPSLANGIVLLSHIKNHLRKGLGLRQMIDWMMYVYRSLDNELWDYEFKTVAKNKGLDTLAIVSTRMCQIYLGLPETINWCKNADKMVCEQLIDCLLDSGNFGRKNIQGSAVESAVINIKRKGLFKWLQYSGEQNWKAYQKHHWLKPFCWLYQIFRYSKKSIEAKRNKEKLEDGIKRSSARYELLKKLNIT